MWYEWLTEIIKTFPGSLGLTLFVVFLLMAGCIEEK